MSVIRAMIWRELVRFARQPARAIATMGTPIILMLGLAAGLSGELGTLSDAGYAGFLLPGVIAMAALFAAAFGAISLIDDRDNGPLLAILAGPAPVLRIGLSKVVALGTLALLQSCPLLAGAWLVGLRPSLPDLLLASLGVASLCFGTTGIALALAWRSRDASSFHGIMNALLLPSWMLAGAFYPADTAHTVMRWLTICDPLAWPVATIRLGLLGESRLPIDPWITTALTIAYAGVGAAAGILKVPRRSRS